MDQPSQQLADRYHLRLTKQWRAWFDLDWNRVRPAGAMRSSLSVSELCQVVPAAIWPGFMLPDTLPVIGNEYGDWLCVRISPHGELGELIYWYHGGGDWIPVGESLAEALLHDAVDQFRRARLQMLRGASESGDKSQADVLQRMREPDLRDWLCANLPESRQSAAGHVSSYAEIEQHLTCGRYRAAVELLHQHGWSPDAAACDLIDVLLQGPLESIAIPGIAQQLELPWYPSYINYLFDAAKVPPAVRERISEVVGGALQQWPEQDWEQAGHLADQVIARRQDLGWAYTIAGWSRERSGRHAEAAQVYWHGRLASSFADQSVRLNGHGSTGNSGKFSIERLGALRRFLTQEQVEEDYLELFFQTRTRTVLAEVQEFWQLQGDEFQRQTQPTEAYEAYYRSGWDLGVSRLSDYRPILLGLRDSAQAAGWKARAAVAQVHLSCLQK